MSHANQQAAPARDAGSLPLAGIRQLTVPSRFCGPSTSGNGGYTCGRIAGYLDGPVTVTLRRPVPLDAPLDAPLAVERADDASLRLFQDRTLIAEAASAASLGALKVPDPVSLGVAHMVACGARYFWAPFFPDCFVCGMNRRPGDGLRIFPGPVPGRELWAAPWTPHPSVAGTDGRVRPEVVWAALDCPGGIAVAENDCLAEDTAVVLGRMTASLTALPAPGDPCVVIAWPGGGDGRKLTAGSALLGPGGEVLAVAWAVWVTVPRPGAALPGAGAPRPGAGAS